MRLRGNTYYFRCRVPNDLHGTFFQGREILKSLHTGDKKLAKDFAAEWYCRVTKAFHLCRIHSLPYNQLQEVVLTGVGMGSRIPAIQIQSRFRRYVVGGATFCFYDQLSILEA